MTHAQKGMLTFTSASLALAMFTTPVKIGGAQESPLQLLEQRQHDDRERFSRAKRQEFEELRRAEESLNSISREQAVWRLLWLRKAHAERRWRRDYLDMIQRQERERRRLGELVAKGEVK